MKIEITNQEKWHQSLTLKLILLAFLGLVLMIPIEMIKSVIMERQASAEKVKQEISGQWAAKQYFTGPVLNIPVKIISQDKEEKSTTQIWHILPETLNIEGIINPEIRYRGIYKSVVYESLLKVSGEFILPEKTMLPGSEILWEESFFTVGITDNRGLRGDVILKTPTHTVTAEPGVKYNDIFESGISFNTPLTGKDSVIPFSMEVSLAGSEGLYLAPLGKVSRAVLSSDWKDPGFNGSFLPTERNVGKDGFQAKWQVTHLNRNFPQQWTGNLYHPSESSFGVDLYLPADHYQKSWRSARYGILFIALTFLVLIFLEITRKEPIHIFHYFLVSLGLVLFFSLLNSLSEHVGFNLAYLISSAATIILISLFTGSLMKDRRAILIIGGLLVVLYTFIFFLLSLSDYAYLAGNIGLFILLAIVMRLAGKMIIFKSETD